MSDKPIDVERLVFSQTKEGSYPTLITRAEDGVIVWASDTSRLAFRERYGVDDPIGRSILSFQYHESPEARAANLEAARREGGHLRRDDVQIGDQRHVRLVKSKTFIFEGVEYLGATLVDISDVVQVEADRDDALARLQRAQEIARLGDFESEINSGVFNGSAIAMELLGFGDERTVSTSDLFAHFHPDDRGRVARTMNEQMPKGSFRIEHRLHPERVGEDIWVYTQATVDTTDDGRSIVRGTVQDITERKRSEVERREMQNKMQETQKLESLGLLAGGIAHDFNNILAGIMGNADFALLSANLPPDVEARLRDVVAASKRAGDLTKQLLAYSGKGRFVIEAVDLSGLIQEMAELLSVSVSREHALRLFLAENLPAVEVDVTQIRQVVMNLIINAGEAINHSNGVISITTGTQELSAEYLAGGQLNADLVPGEYVYVEVSDNGMGMPEEVLERIFDPFFTTKFTGRGLGLAAALGIVRGHRGAIKIYSEQSRGTTFKIFLPTTDVEAKAREGALAEHDWRGDGVVLVIDDDEAVRDFVSNVLGEFGYEVLIAVDGLAGMAQFSEHRDRIDLVLLDLTMPNMDGKETYAQMRAKRPDVATVLMSGYNEQDATQEFVGKGLAGFLAKPFLVADLMGIVEMALAARDGQA